MGREAAIPRELGVELVKPRGLRRSQSGNRHDDDVAMVAAISH
jgi:hypothetical protein